MLGSIRNYFILIIIVPLLVVLAISSWVGVRSIEKELERRLQEEVELVARTLRYPVADALGSGRVSALESSLFAAIDIRRIYGVYVYNIEGELLVSVGPVTPDDLIHFGSLIQNMSLSSRHHFQEYTVFNREEVFSFFEPLIDLDGQIQGYLQVVRERSAIFSYIDHAKFVSSIFIALLVLLLLLILIGGHTVIIDRPFSKLLKSIERFDFKEIKNIPEVSFPREFKILSHSLNEMITRMRESQDEIKINNEQRLKLEKKLVNSKKMAAIGELAAGVAHDIGNPMSVIDATSQKLLRTQGADQKTREKLISIREEVEKMQGIIRSLLDYSHQKTLYNVEVNIRHIVTKALDNYIGPDSDIDVESKLIEKMVLIDPVKFEQVLVNLIQNAIDSMSEKENKKLKVELALEPVSTGKENLILVVDDSGPGVTEQKREEIFEVFYSEKPAGRGSGLGLAICSNIVELYHGKLECSESSLGGASFKATFSLEKNAGEA